MAANTSQPRHRGSAFAQPAPCAPSPAPLCPSCSLRPHSLSSGCGHCRGQRQQSPVPPRQPASAGWDVFSQQGPELVQPLSLGEEALKGCQQLRGRTCHHLFDFYRHLHRVLSDGLNGEQLCAAHGAGVGATVCWPCPSIPVVIVPDPCRARSAASASSSPSRCCPLHKGSRSISKPVVPSCVEQL